MAEIRVTPQELKSRADDLERYNRSLRDEIAKMEGYEQQLAGMWEGEAQKAFHNAFTTDKGKMERFALNIDKYIQALREDAMRYETAENAATNIANTRK